MRRIFLLLLLNFYYFSPAFSVDCLDVFSYIKNNKSLATAKNQLEQVLDFFCEENEFRSALQLKIYNEMPMKSLRFPVITAKEHELTFFAPLPSTKEGQLAATLMAYSQESFLRLSAKEIYQDAVRGIASRN